MEKLVSFFALIWVATSSASDMSPNWGAQWQAHVTTTYCELRKEYRIPTPNDPASRGFLSETAFDRAFVRFTANTRLHGSVIPPESLGVIRFHLYVYPEDFPIAASERISEASLGGIRSEAHVVSNAEIHIFSLNAEDTALLLQRFINNEVVDFNLTFANGDLRQFKIYPSGNRNFYVRAEMFNTCIRENTSEKLKYH